MLGSGCSPESAGVSTTTPLRFYRLAFLALCGVDTLCSRVSADSASSDAPQARRVDHSLFSLLLALGANAAQWVTSLPCPTRSVESGGAARADLPATRFAVTLVTRPLSAVNKAGAGQSAVRALQTPVAQCTPQTALVHGLGPSHSPGPAAGGKKPLPESSCTMSHGVEIEGPLATLLWHHGAVLHVFPTTTGSL
jgi:hypothetical protein